AAPAAKRGKQQSFVHSVPGQGPPARAERLPQGHLFLSRGRLRQLQIGDVGAGDEQDETNSAEQNQQHRARLRCQAGQIRLDPNPDFVPPNLVRISGLERLEDRFHLGLRLLARHARLKPREYGVVVTLSRAARIDAPGHYHAPLPVAVSETLRRHSYYCVGIAVDRNTLARDGRVGAEAPPPQSVAQNRYALAVRRILLLREAAPNG